MKVSAINIRDFDLRQYTAKENIPVIASRSPIVLSLNEPLMFHDKPLAECILLLETDINGLKQFFILNRALKSKYSFPDFKIYEADLYLCFHASGKTDIFPVLRPKKWTGMDPERYNTLKEYVEIGSQEAVSIQYKPRPKSFLCLSPDLKINAVWPNPFIKEHILFDLCNGYIINDDQHHIMEYAQKKPIIIEELDC